MPAHEYHIDEELFAGTLAPRFRASDNPIAIACSRLFTFLPLLPDLSVPRLNSCMASSIFFSAIFPYFLGILLNGILSANEPYQDHDDRNDQKDMNESAYRI